MFRSRGRYSSYGRRKRKRRISPWTVILMLPVMLIVLEIVARLGAGFFEKNQQQLSAEAIAYSLKFVDQDKQTYDGLDNRGKLMAQPQLSTAYSLVGDQKSDFWTINAQGFREDEPLPLDKPNGEIRVFILGSSAAFGRGTPGNQATIAHHLEQQFKARISRQQSSPATYRPDVFPFFPPSRQKLFGLPPKIKQGNYRVVNVAVPGYTSGNELAQFALEILPYKPDLVILLNGYDDLLLPSNETATRVPNLAEFAQNPDGYFNDHIRRSLQAKLERSALIKTAIALSSPEEVENTSNVLSIREQNTVPLAQQLPGNDEELQARVSRYQNNLKQIVALCGSARIPLIVAIQPEITGRSSDKLSPEEQALLQNLGQDYQAKVSNAFPQLITSARQLEKAFPSNIKVLDFYNLGDQFPAPTFTDPVHITEAANQEIAKQIYAAASALPKMQIIPENFYLDDDD